MSSEKTRTGKLAITREGETDRHVETEEGKGFRRSEEVLRTSGKHAQALAGIQKSTDMEKTEKGK